jgi:hypothetical protein
MKLATNFDVNAVETQLTESELRMIYNFLVSFFIGMLKRVKPKDLQEFIDKNTTLDIRPFISQLPANILPRIQKIVRENRELLNKYINRERFIKKAKEQRPDLYKVLTTPKGLVWTERLLKYIKRVINNL